MKKFPSILLIAVTANVSWLASAAAQSIVSVQFATNATGYQTDAATALGALETAGVEAAANWNTLTGASGAVNNLKDSTGTATTLDITFAGPYIYSYAATSATLPDQHLFSGILSANSGTPATTTISDISFSSYDVLVYLHGGYQVPGSISLTASGTTTFYFQTLQSTTLPDGGFTQITNTDSGQHPFGEYVRINGLTGNTLNISAISGSGGTLGIVGLQIIGVPEPGTAGLLVLSAVLAGFGYRRPAARRFRGTATS